MTSPHEAHDAATAGAYRMAFDMQQALAVVVQAAEELHLAVRSVTGENPTNADAQQALHQALLTLEATRRANMNVIAASEFLQSYGEAI